MLQCPPKPGSRRHELAYTGIARYGECGCSITASNVRNRFGRRYTYYHCTKKRGTCSEPYVRVEQLERQIFSYANVIHEQIRANGLSIGERREILKSIGRDWILLAGQLLNSRTTRSLDQNSNPLQVAVRFEPAK